MDVIIYEFKLHNRPLFIYMTFCKNFNLLVYIVKHLHKIALGNFTFALFCNHITGFTNVFNNLFPEIKIIYYYILCMYLSIALLIECF